jgi:hypothetical protein
MTAIVHAALFSPTANSYIWLETLAYPQADSFHYFHHRYFEVNYAGVNCSFLDQLFGTFEGKFREKRGEAKQRDDAKSTLRAAPALEFVGYLFAAFACMASWAWRANAIARGHGSASFVEAAALALLAGFGPVAVACAMTVAAAAKSASASGAGVGGAAMRALLAPHEKRPAWEHMVHVAVGTVCCSVPISWACYLAMI